MTRTFSRLWDMFFVGLLLFLAALPVSAFAGPVVALTVWMIGVASHQPLVWTGLGLAGPTRFASWAAGALAGVLCFLALRTAVGHVVAGTIGTIAAGATTLACARSLATTGATASIRTGPLSRDEPRSWHARELKWLLGSFLASLLFMLVVVGIWGDAAPDVHAASVAGVSAFTYLASGVIRAIHWLSCRPGRRYAPDVLAVLGVCLLAYGGLGVLAEGDGDDASSNRYLATLGAGLAGAGIAIRRRPPVPNSLAADD